MTKRSKSGGETAAVVAAKAPNAPKDGVSKLDRLKALLVREGGASLEEMMAATSWQAHSVRGALAGALKKQRGLMISSAKADGVRRYSATLPADAH